MVKFRLTSTFNPAAVYAVMSFRTGHMAMHGQRPTCAVCQLGPSCNHDLLRFDFQSIVINVQNELQFWTSLRYARICLCAVSKRICMGVQAVCLMCV